MVQKGFLKMFGIVWPSRTRPSLRFYFLLFFLFFFGPPRVQSARGKVRPHFGPPTTGPRFLQQPGAIKLRTQTKSEQHLQVNVPTCHLRTGF
jgi:hypothetical protein